jgi:hypothetical protein
VLSDHTIVSSDTDEIRLPSNEEASYAERVPGLDIRVLVAKVVIDARLDLRYNKFRGGL